MPEVPAGPFPHEMPTTDHDVSQRPGASEALEETKRNAKLTTEATSHGPHNESRTSAVSSRLSRMPSLPAPISQPLLLGFFTLCP